MKSGNELMDIKVGKDTVVWQRFARILEQYQTVAQSMVKVLASETDRTNGIRCVMGLFVEVRNNEQLRQQQRRHQCEYQLARRTLTN